MHNIKLGTVFFFLQVLQVFNSKESIDHIIKHSTVRFLQKIRYRENPSHLRLVMAELRQQKVCEGKIERSH